MNDLSAVLSFGQVVKVRLQRGGKRRECVSDFAEQKLLQFKVQDNMGSEATCVQIHHEFFFFQRFLPSSLGLHNEEFRACLPSPSFLHTLLPLHPLMNFLVLPLPLPPSPLPPLLSARAYGDGKSRVQEPPGAVSQNEELRQT